jgi:alpha-L-fucosidase
MHPVRAFLLPAVVVVSMGHMAGTPAGPAGALRAGLQAPAKSGSDLRMAWWREARFGMFIHFGLYAVPAGEWNGRTDYGEWIRNNAQIPIDTYDGFRARFNPTGFDAAAWVRLAKQAGMKYVIVTTKHHDGFCLFDSKETDFDVMSTPFKRDIMKELSEACRREGMRLGWYYSIMDWHHPDYLPRRGWERRSAEGADFDRYVRYMKAQLKELLTNYGKIDILWFDGQWEGTWNNDRGRDLYQYVRSLQPDIIVNNRVGRDQDAIGDFGTPEQEIPATGLPGVDWETCMTMNDNWGYNRADTNFKPAEDLIRKLADIASKGGNFLLNVGPTAEGVIPPESVDRLQSIGRWMQPNGESIHGTTASPLGAVPWGRITMKAHAGSNARLYLHAFDWPHDGRLVVPGLLNGARQAYLLSDPIRRQLAAAPAPGTGVRRLLTLREGEALAIEGPVEPADPVDAVVVLDLTGLPDVVRPPQIAAPAPIFVGRTEVVVTTEMERVELRYTTDGSEPLLTSPPISGPVELSDTTTVRARSFRRDLALGPITTATFTKVTPRRAVDPGPVVQGLRYDVFEGDFKILPDFDALAPARSGASAGFDLALRTRQAQFALRFRGYVRVPSDGVYRFFVRSDDGSRLWIGDQLVVDNDGLHGPREESGVVALAAGLHPITVAMFEQGGGFVLEVAYSGPGLARQPIPPVALFRPVQPVS